jgi:sulfoxide reductase heme-binding subunit YedZ
VPLAALVWRAFGVFGSTLGANPVDEITDTLGKWGLRLLLVTLAITPLRQLTDWPHWLRFRRMLGLFACFYITLHFAMYFAIDQSFDWSVLWEDISKRPWITLGFTALVLLVPLALTSTRGWMRRLGRRWQTLHYAIYIATALGCWHYYWQVKRDVRSPLLYVAAFTLLMGWRAWRRMARRRRSSPPAMLWPGPAAARDP